MLGGTLECNCIIFPFAFSKIISILIEAHFGLTCCGVFCVNAAETQGYRNIGKLFNLIHPTENLFSI